VTDRLLCGTLSWPGFKIKLPYDPRQRVVGYLLLFKTRRFDAGVDVSQQTDTR